MKERISVRGSESHWREKHERKERNYKTVSGKGEPARDTQTDTSTF